MPSEEENCHLVTVTEEEIKNCVRVIPRLDTLILVKAMGHRKRFGNPFRVHPTANTSQSFKFRIKNSMVRSPFGSSSSSPSTNGIINITTGKGITPTKPDAHTTGFSISDSEMHSSEISHGKR